MSESPADWAKGLMNTNCTSASRTVVEQRIEVQEKVGFVWNTRGSGVNNPNQVDPPAYTLSVSCAGHGTDNWRTKAVMFDNLGGDLLAYYPSSGGVSLVCSP
jgi:hypothetical protein